MLVARALPAGLGATAKCKRYLLTGPKCQQMKYLKMGKKK
jgi:hypothetical protein